MNCASASSPAIDGRVVSEAEFRARLQAWAINAPACGAVTGPGRSGAIAAAYASHALGVPFLPFKALGGPADPILIIDTATNSGRTLRKAAAWYERRGKRVLTHALFDQPPRVRFWYEARRLSGKSEYAKAQR